MGIAYSDYYWFFFLNSINPKALESEISEIVRKLAYDWIQKYYLTCKIHVNGLINWPSEPGVKKYFHFREEEERLSNSTPVF